MQKTGRTTAQLAVMALFALSCFGLLLFLWVSFGGSSPLRPKGYRVEIPMREVASVATAADVRISGVPVGRIVGQRREGDRTVMEIELQPRYAPLRSDARATLRRKTLLGEGYLELTPGSKAAATLPEGARLRAANVAPSVELDEIFQDFDEPTRRATQRWLRGWEAGVRGRAEDLSEILAHLPGLLDEGQGVLGVLRGQQTATRTLLRDTGRTFATIGEEGSRIDDLILSGRQVFRTTAARERDLRATVRALPPFLRELRGTLDAAARLAPDATPVAADLRPAVRRLRPVLEQAAAVAPQLESTTRRLDSVLDVSTPGLGALRDVVRSLRPLLAQLYPLGRQLSPMTAFSSLYRRELANSWPKVSAAVQARSPDPVTGKLVHYLRATSTFSNETLVLAEKRQPYSRPSAYAAPGGVRELENGFLKAFDCSHTKNPMTVPSIVLDAPAPPCVTQEPVEFRGNRAQYHALTPDP